MAQTGSPGNPVNTPTDKSFVNFSKFNLHRRRWQTMLFGLISPHMVLEGVSTDKLPLQSSHALRSYTLGNVLMSDIKMHKEYFAVNYDAILPRNWEKVYKNPSQGDDVNYDVGMVVPAKEIYDFLQTIRGDFCTYAEESYDRSGANSNQFSSALRCLLALEMFCSNGSLLRTLGYGFNRFFTKVNGFDTSEDSRDFNVIDWYFDRIFNRVCSHPFQLIFYKEDWRTQDSVYLSVPDVDTYSSARFISPHEAIQKMRENPRFKLIFMEYVAGSWDVDGTLTFRDIIGEDDVDLIYSFSTIPEPLDPSSVSNGDDAAYVNFYRVAAYQIACHHFFSNDHVDYIYTAELYREMMRSILSSAYDSIGDVPDTFSYNGVRTDYDVFSGHNLSYLFRHSWEDSMFFFVNLFGFNRSLRYRDYFVGSRPQPLAVGDVNVAVNNNLVSIIDTTKMIATQRFLNQVARIGRKIKDYLSGLFPGVRVEPSLFDPTWLARSDHDVKSVEVENTGEAQYSSPSSVTSVLRSNDSRYIFEFEVGRPAIIIGMTYFDVPRAYISTFDRNVLAKDRFDMFIPQLQYVGDQSIYLSEIGKGLSTDPFSYTLRDMQYKQLFDVAIGGFIDNLPGWCFLAPAVPEYGHISPDFIRSSPAELDKYYLSLTGYSLGSYFHFNLMIDNVIEASRPMAYAPSIL